MTADTERRECYAHAGVVPSRMQRVSTINERRRHRVVAQLRRGITSWSMTIVMNVCSGQMTAVGKVGKMHATLLSA